MQQKPSGPINLQQLLASHRQLSELVREVALVRIQLSKKDAFIPATAIFKYGPGFSFTLSWTVRTYKFGSRKVSITVTAADIQEYLKDPIAFSEAEKAAIAGYNDYSWDPATLWEQSEKELFERLKEKYNASG